MTYEDILTITLKDFDRSKHYLEFKCSNINCDVCNYATTFSTATYSLYYRPNSGCRKCGSKILINIKVKEVI